MPLGGEHYSTMNDAISAAENNFKDESVDSPKLTKTPIKTSRADANIDITNDAAYNGLWQDTKDAMKSIPDQRATMKMLTGGNDDVDAWENTSNHALDEISRVIENSFPNGNIWTRLMVT